MGLAAGAAPPAHLYPSGMVASTSAPATRAGVEVLRAGGNAVDAAVAVGLALAVTYPAAGNLGGGGFMMIRMADGRTAALDFRETAPAAATRDMFLDAAGRLVPDRSVEGELAAGVPGTVAGFEAAWRRFGTASWRDLVAPARRLATEGFDLSPALARSFRETARLGRFPESRRIFQRDGRYYAAGERFRQPELAATLTRLQEQGPGEFYRGETAGMIERHMRARGGLITRKDLESYRAVWREPLIGSYRGCQLLTMPPPSSGGIALLQMLGMLSGSQAPRALPDSGERLHLLVECMKRAFADRAHHLGDPDFVRVPVKALLDDRYHNRLRSGIDPARATPAAEIRPLAVPRRESSETTHYSVVDAWGNAVSTTTTLNLGYGCGVTVAGAGFLLNNEMDDFAAKPGEPNAFGLIQGEANAIGPGKRPLSSMTPTIVSRKGDLYLVVGSPGGPTIINTVLQVVTNVIDHGMDLETAVNAPRIHHQWLPDEVRVEPGGVTPEAREHLRTRGHRFAAREAPIGDVQAIQANRRTGLRGVSDRRSPDGLALSE